MNPSPASPASGPAAVPPLEYLVQRWMLRIIVPQKGYRHFVGADGYENNTIAQFLGLDTSFDSDSLYSPSDALSLLRGMHARAEAEAPPALPVTLQRNLEQLTVLLGLSAD
jgi:hypothetical protein